MKIGGERNVEQTVVGVIGAGRIGQMHIRNIVCNMPNVRLKTVADTNLDETWAANQNIEVKTRNSSAVLDDLEIEAVLITTSSTSHVELIKAAAEAGKQIFCEKPIAFDPARINEAVQAAKSAGVILQVGFNRRFDSEFVRVHDTVMSGKIGVPHIVKITNRDPKRPDLNFIPNSGGLFMDFCIHDFDTARYVTHCEVIEVYAAGAVLVDPEIGKLNDIDTAVTTLKFNNGSLGIIDNSRETHYGYDQQVEVFGSKGSIHACNTKPTNTILTSEAGVYTDKPYYSFVERYRDAFITELREFFTCIREKTKPRASGEDAIAAVRIAQAAAQSFKENRPIEVVNDRTMTKA